MIEMLDIGIENAVAYRIGGKITEDEMKSVLSIFKEKIQAGAKILIYQEIMSVGGAEVDAIMELKAKLKKMAARFAGLGWIGKCCLNKNEPQ